MTVIGLSYKSLLKKQESIYIISKQKSNILIFIFTQIYIMSLKLQLNNERAHINIDACDQASSSNSNNFEDMYQQAELFLDNIDFQIVIPEPTRKPLTIRQYLTKEEGIAEKSAMNCLSRALSAPAKIEANNVFDLKSIKESPLMQRRKFAASIITELSA